MWAGKDCAQFLLYVRKLGGNNSCFSYFHRLVSGYKTIDLNNKEKIYMGLIDLQLMLDLVFFWAAEVLLCAENAQLWGDTGAHAVSQ